MVKLGKIKLEMNTFGHLRVTTIGDKVRETHLRWFEHIQRRPATILVRKSLDMKVDGL